MSCNNKKISDKLILYLENELSPEETAEVKEHLNSCSDCRRQLEEMSEIIGALKSASDEIRKRWVHPSPEELCNFVEDKGVLKDEEKEKIKIHLKLCPSCSRDAVLMKEAPSVEPVEKVSAEVPLPVINLYRQEYVKEKKIKTEPQTPGPEPESIFSKLFLFLEESHRFSLAATALLAVIFFLIGIFFGPYLVGPGKAPRQAQFSPSPSPTRSFETFIDENAPDSQITYPERRREQLISAFSVVDNPDSHFLWEEEQIPTRDLTKMEERERTAVTVQNYFRSKIIPIFGEYRGLANSKLNIKVKLSENSISGDYPIESVKITIYYYWPLSASEKVKIREEIRREIEWEDDWQGGIEFIPY